MIDRILLAFPEGKEKALTLSYDDGVDTDAHMIELLEKYKIKCTFNINAGLFSPEGAVREEGRVHFRLPKSDARKLYNHPLCEVATHSFVHAWYNYMPAHLVMEDIMADRRELEAMFGKLIRGHAYPYGAYTDGVVDVLKKADIVYARTVCSQHSFTLPEDWLRWGATCHHGDPKFRELAEQFINEDVPLHQHGWLFYLWGHTYEFRQDDNWGVIEDFFDKVSGNSNIWYATNMEIYAYITAWRSLVYSASGEYVYNPTAIDLWLRVVDMNTWRAKTVCIPAGATVKI